MGYEPAWWEHLFWFGPPIMTGLAIFAGVYFGVRITLKYWSPQERNAYGAVEPMNIVRERYAKGEISRSEYERLREDLK